MLLSTHLPHAEDIVVRSGWWNEQKDLLPSEHMVPDRGAPKVQVEVCVASCHTHQTISERVGGGGGGRSHEQRSSHYGG